MPTSTSSEIPSSERASSSGAAMQAVATGGDEVMRSATSEKPIATKLSPASRINYPSAEILQNLLGSKMVLRCAERVLCRERAMLQWFSLKKEKKRKEKKLVLIASVLAFDIPTHSTCIISMSHVMIPLVEVHSA